MDTHSPVDEQLFSVHALPSSQSAAVPQVQRVGVCEGAPLGCSVGGRVGVFGTQS